jgi:hypothetical protein
MYGFLGLLIIIVGILVIVMPYVWLSRVAENSGLIREQIAESRKENRTATESILFELRLLNAMNKHKKTGSEPE